MTTTLWDHQRRAVEIARDRLRLAIFYGTGTGKTLTTIEILREDYNLHKQLRPTLIVTKLSVCKQWKSEFAKFAPKISQDRIHVLTDAGPKRLKRLQAMSPDSIVITNYEATRIKAFWQAVTVWQPRIVVLDESHSIANAASMQSKAIYPVCDSANRVFCLTGTPMPNSMLDLFGQYRALDRGVFGNNYWTYRARYFYDKNAGMPSYKHFPDWQPRPDTAKELGDVLAHTSVQARKEDCIALPELLKIDIECEMGAKQEKAYLQMKKEFLAVVGESVCSAEFAMTKSLRLQQILCGFILPDDDENNEPLWFDDVPRLSALEDKLEELKGQKVIIWTTFRATYPKLKAIAEKLGRSVAFLTGDQSSGEKDAAIDNFCHGATDTLIAHPRAGGVGVNLQQAGYSIYYTRGYSSVDYAQSMARNYRGGSVDLHDKVTHYHLVTPDTLDAVIASALDNKEKIADAVLAWARKK